MIDIFLSNSQLSQKIHRKHFCWSLFLSKLEILKQKGNFCKGPFLKFLKFQNIIYFLFIPIHVATYKISKNRLVDDRLVYHGLHVIMKNIKFIAHSSGLQFQKNDSIARRALKTKLFFKGIEKVSGKKFVLESPCCKVLGLQFTT